MQSPVADEVGTGHGTGSSTVVHEAALVADVPFRPTSWPLLGLLGASPALTGCQTSVVLCALQAVDGASGAAYGPTGTSAELRVPLDDVGASSEAPAA